MRQRGRIGLLAWLLGAGGAAGQLPAEVSDLRLTPDGVAVWSVNPGATAYRVYRGDRASLGDLATTLEESCLLGEHGVSDASRMAGRAVAPGDLDWFLVTAVYAGGEGSPGPGRSLEPWGGCCGGVAFAEHFPGADAAPWPARWQAGFEVDRAEVRGGRSYLRPVLSGYSLARRYAHADLGDVDVSFRLEFEDVARQGIGFYVRANGGYLQQTSPFGQGYAVFVEGFRGTPGIGVWKEEDGVESSLDVRFDPALDLRDGVAYRVRFRVLQLDPLTTRLQARIWRDGEIEPSTWDVRYDDRTPALQGVRGGVAVDSWSSLNAGGPSPAFTIVDDVRVVRLCDPVAGASAVVTVEEGFQFTEGPSWSDGVLRFSDIEADTVYRLEGAPPAVVERRPSGRANGLARAGDGAVVACEQGGRRLSRDDGVAVTSLVERYQGMRLNAPNDLAVRGDGSIYFSDPGYGLDPAERELPYNGLFRLAPDGLLSAPWQGDPVASGPNGVALAPDQRTLYLADSERGEVLAFAVLDGGGLGPPRVFASGLNLPDGLCVDMAGNLYVATWASTIEVLAPDGGAWGSLAVPRAATNCGFGGRD